MPAPGARPHVEARHNLPAGLGLPHLYSRTALCCLRLFLGDGLTTSTGTGHAYRVRLVVGHALVFCDFLLIIWSLGHRT
jgi:hypothetical protein